MTRIRTVPLAGADEKLLRALLRVCRSCSAKQSPADKENPQDAYSQTMSERATRVAHPLNANLYAQAKEPRDERGVVGRRANSTFRETAEALALQAQDRHSTVSRLP